MKKYLLSILVLVCLLGNSVAVLADASGSCGDSGVTWSYNSTTHELTIAGSGVMPDYGATNMPWNSYKSSITSITISSGVTTLGNNAFYNCTNVTSVSIASSVTTVKDWAFQNLSSLTTISIPSSITSFGSGAFSGCSKLSEVKYASSATNWANIYFAGSTANPTYYAKGLKCNNSSSVTTSITLGSSSVHKIKQYAFYNNTALTSVSFTSDIEEIATYAFYGCENIAGKVEIPAVSAMGAYVFQGCKKITEFYVSPRTTLTSFPASMLRECTSLERVNIPKSITSLGTYAFYNCSALQYIFVQTLTEAPTVGSNALSGVPTSTTKIQAITSATKSSLNSKASWKSFTSISWIGSYTITYDSKHTLTMLSRDDTNDTMYVSTQVKSGVSLSGIVSLPPLFIMKNGLFYGFNIKPTTVADNGYKDCTEITSVTIGNTYTTVGTSAFNGCSKLATVKFGSSTSNQCNITSIGNSAFTSCSKVANVYCYGGIDKWLNITFGNSASNPFYASTVTQTFYLNSTASPDITIPAGVTAINAYAFYKHTHLHSITIGPDVTSLGSQAFENCTGLVTLDMSEADNLETIGYSIFDGCSNIEGELYIPAKVSSIGTWTFNDCSKVTAFYVMPTSVPTVTNSNTFTYMVKSIPFYVSTPAALTSYSEASYWNAFTNMKIGGYCGASPDRASVKWEYSTSTNALTITGTRAGIMENYTSSNHAPWYALRASITSVKICNGVTHVGNYAFNGCSSATEIWTSTTVTSFGDYAFNGCSGLNNVKYGNTSSTTLSYATDWAQIDFGNSEANPLTHAHTLQIYKSTSTIPAWGTVTAIEGNRGLTEIKKNAFYGCTSLTSSTLPSTLESVGAYAFRECSNLSSSITIPEKVTYMGDMVFTGCPITTVEWNATNYTSTNLSSSINPFWSLRSSITSFSFGNSVEYIPSYLCYGMSNASFNEVTIPANVTSMGTNVFQGCSNLRTVNWNATNCTDFTSSTAPFEAVKTNLTYFKFGQGVRHIPAYICKGMANMTGITGGIQGMLIPTSVTSIGTDAFDGCSQFTRVDYQADNSYTVTYIDDWSQINFASAKANPLYYAGTLYVIIPPASGSQSVPGLGEQRDLVFKETTTTIKPYAFVNLTRATSVTFGMEMSVIGANAFDGCTNIASVTSWAETPPTLGTDVWNGVPANTPIYVLCSDIETAYKATNWNRFTGTWSYLIAVCNDNLVISSDKNMSAAVASSFRGNILVKSGVTFTMNDVTYSRHVYIKNVTLEPTARVELTNNARYKINNLIMQRSGNSSADDVATAEIKGSLTAENLILDFTLDDSRWFPLSLPQTISVSNVTIGGSPLNVDVNDGAANCYAMYFDGARRATEGFSDTGDNWQWLGNSSSFEANKGYLIGLPGGTRTLRFTMPGFAFNETADKNVSVLENHSENSLDAGWNLIGNPYLQAYHHSDDAMSVGSESLTAVVLVSAEGEHLNYDETEVSDAIIPPFSAAFIQSPATGSLVFDNASARKNILARRSPATEKHFLQLALAGNGASARTNFIIGDDYDENYTIGADLVKWFNDNYKVQAAPTLYSFKGDNRQAFNARSEEMMTNVPVGYYATKAGSYTFSLGKDASAFEHVWLYDSENDLITDLKTIDYTFETVAGSVDSRFMLTATLMAQPEVPTEVECTETRDESGESRVKSGESRVESKKFLRNGTIYIQRGDKVYTVTGQEVM